MGITQSLLMLLLFTSVNAAVGPAAVAHRAPSASLSDAQETLLNDAMRIMKPEMEAAQENSDLSLGVVQETAHKVLPPPLWKIFFEELPELMSKSNYKPEAQAEFESLPNFNWLEKLTLYYLPNTTNVSPECRRDVNAISAAIAKEDSWAQKMVDSWGKFSDGLLAGNTMQMGLLDECLLISVDSQDPDAHFRGQYCAVSIGMKPKSRQALEEGYEEEEEEEEERVEVMIPELHIANMKGVLKMALPYNIMATCIPSTCTKEEYRTSLVDQLNNSGLALSTLECQTKDLPTLRYNAADIIMIITLVVLGILVLVGTVADVWIQNSENREAAQGPLRYFIVFSFYTNLSKIFRINVKENEEVISCLHGIRALSMCWVVFAHSFLLSITASANKSLVTQWQAVLGWIVALATMSAVVFGLKDYNTLTMKPHEYVPAISILYGGLHRLAWGVAVAWMIYACHMGYGGPINSLLGHPIWQPLSRLTYPIFLIALNVQTIYYSYYSRLPIYFTPFYKLMETAGILLISSFGGVLLSLLAESPVLGLEKLLLRKPTTSTTTTTTTIKFT
ncbi:Nose resistant to fluoxetine protein 6 [Portunus trituberculatus]|uniref:Nose resistant to fluoxetine protein 6 n=1 Tax=Portunus trituberculatus TaxID=210409 RepID=A0A5B7DUJ4_PORTR|nr:Nose resistant to fluoxetine protein 6 [Portunus trituberculatus]